MSVDILDRVYDAYTGEMGQHMMRATQERVHWMCAGVQGNSVLDVGCSQGLLPILLGREGKSVLGIDSSAAAIRSAEQHLADEPVSVRKRVSFVEADFDAHQFGEVRFDCIVMGELLEHLLAPERFLERAASLLRPGARLIVTVPFGINDHVDHKHTFYLREPLRLLSSHFEVLEVKYLGKWLGLLGVRRAQDRKVTEPGWSDAQLIDLERAFHASERRLVEALGSYRSKFEEADAAHRSSSEEAARYKRAVAHHENERKSAERAHTELDQRLLQAQQRDRERELGMVRLEERLAHAQELRRLELDARDKELGRLREARDELARRRDQQVTELQAQLIRHAERVGALETDLRGLREEARTERRLFERLGLQRDKAEAQTRQLQQERRKRAVAEHNAAHARETLSYQLGYELIQSFKSRRRLLSLPSALWRLQREAARRRAAKLTMNGPAAVRKF